MIRSAPPAPRRRPWTALALAAVIVAIHLATVSGCLSDRVGMSRWTLPREGCEWISRDGDRYRHVWDAAHDAWSDAGLPEPSLRAARVCWQDEPVYGRANGVASAEGRIGVLTLRRLDTEDARERLVLHELLHAMLGSSGVPHSAYEPHADERIWRPAPDSVELRATCALQPEHQGCAP